MRHVRSIGFKSIPHGPYDGPLVEVELEESIHLNPGASLALDWHINEDNRVEVDDVALVTDDSYSDWFRDIVLKFVKWFLVWSIVFGGLLVGCAIIGAVVGVT